MNEIGEIEMTFMNAVCRASNIAGIFEDPSI